MITPCPHCSVQIEIDPATHAALVGQSHFACPSCQGAVPLPAPVKLQLHPVPGSQSKATTGPGHKARGHRATPRITNRNLLILGATALLSLGGIAFVLASRNSGSTHNTTRNIRNEIINNSYFQNLITTGVTTRKDLESMAVIRPYKDGFIGISAEPLQWEQACDLARRTGSTVLRLDQPASPQDADLVKWLSTTFPRENSNTLWIEKEGAPAVLAGAECLGISSPEGFRQVLLNWRRLISTENRLLESVTKDNPYVNSLGMKFVPVPVSSNAGNTMKKPGPGGSDLIIDPAAWRFLAEPDYSCNLFDLETRPPPYPRWLPGPSGTRLEFNLRMNQETTFMIRIGGASPLSEARLLLNDREMSKLLMTEKMFKGPPWKGRGGEHLGPINVELRITVPPGSHTVTVLNSGEGWFEIPMIRVTKRGSMTSRNQRKQIFFSIWETRVQDYAVFVNETKRKLPEVGFVQGALHPAVRMSWDDAQDFCSWLTERERRLSYIGNNCFYRLPTDHEWSCAVGIGHLEDPNQLPIQKNRMTADFYPWGSGWSIDGIFGNYAGEEMSSSIAAGKYKPANILTISGYNDSFVQTSPVGSFSANHYGLYDLGGNVWEWCDDWYDDTKKYRVWRGASWINDRPETMLSSSRARDPQDWRRAWHGGFRCVLELRF